MAVWLHRGEIDKGGDRIQEQPVDVQHIYNTSSDFAALKADGGVVAWGNKGELEEVKALALRQ